MTEAVFTGLANKRHNMDVTEDAKKFANKTYGAGKSRRSEERFIFLSGGIEGIFKSGLLNWMYNMTSCVISTAVDVQIF